VSLIILSKVSAFKISLFLFQRLLSFILSLLVSP